MVCCAFLSLILACAIGIRRRLGFGQAAFDLPLAWRPGLIQNTDLITTPANARFSLASRLRSFRYAAAGLVLLIRREHNARHAAAAIAVVAMAFWLQVTREDWRWLVISIGMVISAEALNTAIERLCDLVSPGYNDHIRVAKDVAAGAVLMLAIAALIVGVLTLAPYMSRNSGVVPWAFSICRTIG